MREILPTCVGKPFSRDPILVAVGECARGEGAGLHLVIPGYTKFAPGLHLVTPGLHLVTPGYTWLTPGLHLICTWLHLVTPSLQLITPGYRKRHRGERCSIVGKSESGSKYPQGGCGFENKVKSESGSK